MVKQKAQLQKLLPVFWPILIPSLTLDHQVFNVSGNPSTSLQELQLANFLHNLVSADWLLNSGWSRPYSSELHQFAGGQCQTHCWRHGRLLRMWTWVVTSVEWTQEPKLLLIDRESTSELQTRWSSLSHTCSHEVQAWPKLQAPISHCEAYTRHSFAYREMQKAARRTGYYCSSSNPNTNLSNTRQSNTNSSFRHNTTHLIPLHCNSHTRRSAEHRKKKQHESTFLFLLICTPSSLTPLPSYTKQPT
jgi:hypothetical protein